MRFSSPKGACRGPRRIRPPIREGSRRRRPRAVPGPAMAGIATERDLLCATTDPGIDLDAAPVSSVMSTPVQAMSGDEMIYRALGRMDRLRVRHLCVTDASGAVLGMVSQRDLLHHRASAAAEAGRCRRVRRRRCRARRRAQPASRGRGRPGGPRGWPATPPHASSPTRSAPSPRAPRPLPRHGWRPRDTVRPRRRGACSCSARGAAVRACSRPIRTTPWSMPARTVTMPGSQRSGLVWRICSTRPGCAAARAGSWRRTPNGGAACRLGASGSTAGCGVRLPRICSTSTSSTTSCRWRAPSASDATFTPPRSPRPGGHRRSSHCLPSRSPPCRLRSACSGGCARAREGSI